MNNGTGGNKVEKVTLFCYLRNKVTWDAQGTYDIRTRISNPEEGNIHINCRSSKLERDCDVN